MTLVKLVNINKVFETGDVPFQALQNINITIKKGDFVAIIGPSGSGKSTLMNILGLLDKPTSGEYELDGHNTAHLKENTLAELRNKKIGFVFQSFNLLTRTSALDNVALPLIYSGVSRSERLKRATESLKEVGLDEKLKSHPNQLSGGQQQRVAIARALVTNPEIILADEPTGNLDSKNGEEIMKLFHELHKMGRTIILITHDPEVAANAPKVIKIRDGKVVEEDIRKNAKL